jgi:hypothetical protein
MFLSGKKKTPAMPHAFFNGEGLRRDMSILSTIKSWTTEIGVYYAGSLYREDNFPLSWLLRKVLSKVRITDETVEGLKSLSAKGVVVYALKNKSQLNSLILRGRRFLNPCTVTASI